jgi:hypothetical protein
MGNAGCEQMVIRVLQLYRKLSGVKMWIAKTYVHLDAGLNSYKNCLFCWSLCLDQLS